MKLQRYCGNRTERAIGVFDDLTQRKRLESLTEFRLGLLQQAETASVEEIVQKALDEAEMLTDSSFGFIFFLSADSASSSRCIWLSRVCDQMQAMNEQNVHHLFDIKPFLKETIESGRAVIVNEYPDGSRWLSFASPTDFQHAFRSRHRARQSGRRLAGLQQMLAIEQ